MGVKITFTIEEENKNFFHSQTIWEGFSMKRTLIFLLGSMLALGFLMPTEAATGFHNLRTLGGNYGFAHIIIPPP